MLSVLASAYDKMPKGPTISDYPDIKLETIPSLLKKEGYRNMLIHPGGLGYAGQNRFLRNRGFESIVDYDDLKNIPPYNFHVGWGFDERSMIKPSIDFIKKDTTKPFFITYVPVNPHHPYAVPDDFKKIVKHGETINGIRLPSWINYLNSLAYADWALGELLSSLEKEKLLDNTIVFVFADHGEAFYQHKRNYNHPFYLYEENVHVPLVIYNKKLIKNGIVYNDISSHIDIAPTILDILGMKKPEAFEGNSLLSKHRSRLAITHTNWKDDFISVRDSRWKYIRRIDNGHEELYNLDLDPKETTNISSENQKIVERYRNLTRKAVEHRNSFYSRILNNGEKKTDNFKTASSK